MARKISQNGLDLVKSFEGLRLEAYRDAVGIPTIGYGSTGAHVRLGKHITKDEAEALLLKDMRRFEDGVNAIVGPCKQGQFDALCSFSFNLGLGNLLGSTLLKRHKKGDFQGAADSFLQWNKARVNGNLVVLPGLTRRRAAERKLYLS